MIGSNEELDKYVKALGTTRGELNIMYFIGGFLFGLFLPVAFEKMGRKNTGWLYFISILVCLVSGVGALPALVIYIAGWIHANVVLTRCQSLGKARLTELNGMAPDACTADSLLERGLLRKAVLRESAPALVDFADAIQLPGGQPELLNMAGEQYAAAKPYKEAKVFFDRAAASTGDEVLLKRIHRNQKFVEQWIM